MRSVRVSQRVQSAVRPPKNFDALVLMLPLVLSIGTIRYRYVQVENDIADASSSYSSYSSYSTRATPVTPPHTLHRTKTALLLEAIGYPSPWGLCRIMTFKPARNSNVRLTFTRAPTSPQIPHSGHL